MMSRTMSLTKQEYDKQRKSTLEGREKLNAWKRAYHQRHKERLNKKRNERYYEQKKDPEWVKRLNTRQLEYKNKNKVRILKRYKELRDFLKLEVFSYYSNGKPKCACCGIYEIKFLSIDHIHDDGAEHRKKVPMSQLYRWLKRNNWPNGFQVLCMNCNFAKGHFGKCPHGGDDSC